MTDGNGTGLCDSFKAILLSLATLIGYLVDGALGDETSLAMPSECEQRPESEMAPGGTIPSPSTRGLITNASRDPAGDTAVSNSSTTKE